MDLDQFFNIDYKWTDLFFLTIGLIITYALLQFLRKILASIGLAGRLRAIIRRLLDVIIILFEPISILIIVSVFIMIRPALHGLSILILVVIGYHHWRNYFHSRLIRTDRSIKSGRRIRVGDELGIITEIGRLGIQFRSDDGLHYIPYHRLVTEGFVLSSGYNIGGYYNLKIKPTEGEVTNNMIGALSNVLISSPYVDGDHKPEISRSIPLNGSIDVRLLVREESHIQDLIGLLEDNGYTSVLMKSQ